MELKNSQRKKCCEKFTLKKNYFITNDVMCLAQCWRANNKLMRVLNECERCIYQTKSHLHQHTYLLVALSKFQFNWFYRHSHVGSVCLCVSGSAYPLNAWMWLLPTCGHWCFERLMIINVKYQRWKKTRKVWRMSRANFHQKLHTPDDVTDTNERTKWIRTVEWRMEEMEENCHCAPHWYTKQCQRKSGKTNEAA